MYFTTKPGISKLVTIVVGLLVTIIGCIGVFNSELYKQRDLVDLACKSVSNTSFPASLQCPEDWKTKDMAFAALSIISLLLSVVSFALGFVMDLSCQGKRAVDGGYHIVGGILVLTAGALLLSTAIQWDEIAINRKDIKFGEKIAAGAMSIINSLVYFGAALIIFKTQPT